MRYRRFPNKLKWRIVVFVLEPGAFGRTVECVLSEYMSMSMSMLCNMCTLQYTLPQGTKGQNETRETRERAAWLRGRRTLPRGPRCRPWVGWAPAQTFVRNISTGGIPKAYDVRVRDDGRVDTARAPVFVSLYFSLHLPHAKRTGF